MHKIRIRLENVDELEKVEGLEVILDDRYPCASDNVDIDRWGCAPRGIMCVSKRNRGSTVVQFA